MARNIEALLAFVDARHRVPYAWGREANDCVAYVLAAAEAQTGHRVAPKVTWANRAAALRVLKRLGGIEAAFDSCFERIAPAHAHRGDIAGVPDETFGIHPLIIEGNTLVGPDECGNRRLPRSAMTCAWSIEKPRR